MSGSDVMVASVLCTSILYMFAVCVEATQLAYLVRLLSVIREA